MNYLSLVNEGYFVDADFIRWDSLFIDVCSILNERIVTKEISSPSSLECSCDNFLNFKVNRFSGYAPSSLRPLLNVSYALAANDEYSDKDVWYASMKKIFGRPEKIKKENTKSSNSVKFYAIWNLNSVRITLSVLGSARAEYSKLSGAYIFLEYTDIVSIAKPFLSEKQQKEKDEFDDVSDYEILSNYKLNSIIPFFIADYALNKPQQALEDDLLRIAQKALYKNNLLETPIFIKNILKNDEFIIWHKKKKTTEYYCSTKWDTSIIRLGSKRNKISFCNLLPAKGKGCFYLEINELMLKDDSRAEILFNAFQLLENIMGCKLSYHEEYDC